MKYLGIIIISIGLIIAGLSGEFVLRGTDSSIALVGVGVIFLVYDIIKLSTEGVEIYEQNGQDDQQEFVDCLETLEKENVDSLISLGTNYYYGIGTDQDYEQAALWFRKAAELNNAEAQGWLGFMYYKGDDVEQDYNQSAMWYKKAAEQNNAEAQYNLGVMYEEGLGLEQDKEQAEYWFRLSADQGYDLAKEKTSKWGDNT